MFLLAICLGVAVLLAGSAGAVEVTPAAGPAVVTGQAIEKSLAVGESVILDFQGLTRAAISDPAVADVVVLTTAQLLVNGKAQGSTTLYIWDKRGRWTYLLSVTKAPSRVAKLLPRINAEIGLPGVTATEVGGVLVLEGTVTSAAQSARAEAIASIYSKDVKNLIEIQAAPAPPKPKMTAREVQKILGPSYKVSEIAPGTYSVEGVVLAADAERVKREVFPAIEKMGVNIVSLLSVEAPRVRQLLVRAKIVDIDKSAVGDLGLDWGHNRLTTTTTSSVNPDTGQVSTSTGSQTTFVPNEMLFGESLLGPTEHRLLDGGPILRLERFGARLQALVTQNRARVLSEPNLLVKEGDTGKIVIGGEIPIPVAQPGGAGAVTPVTVEWREFGVILTISGRVLEDGESIDLVVMPSVSSLDFGNAITVSGITLPAIRKRSAETRVQIMNGQTLVIGGLFQSEDSKQLRKIPFLGDIPILGEFFKSRHKVKTETELMIFVTPEIIKQASSGGA